MQAEKYEVLFGESKNRLYRFALRIVKDDLLAEDVVQEVHVKCWQNKDAVESMTNPAAWMMRVTKNLCIDKIRAQRATTDLDAVSYNVHAHGTISMNKINTIECILPFCLVHHAYPIRQYVCGMQNIDLGVVHCPDRGCARLDGNIFLNCQCEIGPHTFVVQEILARSTTGGILASSNGLLRILIYNLTRQTTNVDPLMHAMKRTEL